MKNLVFVTLSVLLSAAGLSAAEPAGDFDQYWPHWRGPGDDGVAPHADPPVTWSESENIRWKVPIEGEGSASPIVWGDLVFVTSAVDTGEGIGEEDGSEEVAAPQPPRRPRPPGARGPGGGGGGGGRGRGGGRPRGRISSNDWRFVVTALRRSDGETVWQRTANTERPHEGIHPTGTFASNSAVTDGESLFAYFGSRGIYAYDLEGNPKWKRDLGDMTKRLGFGEGSSPAVGGNALVIIWDHEGESFVVALDKETGDELWRTPRDEMTSWTTPLIVEEGGRAQVVTSATGKVRSYALDNGELLWESRGVTLNAIPAPVYEDGIVYLMSGFRGSALQAIRLADAKGDVSGSKAVLWEYDQDTPYVPSPLLYNGDLYFTKSNNAILSVFDAASGKPHYTTQRIEGLTNLYASPVGAAGRVYITDRKGNTTVIKAGSSYEELAQNSLDDAFDASAAVVGGEIYLRGKNLYCIAEN